MSATHVAGTIRPPNVHGKSRHPPVALPVAKTLTDVEWKAVGELLRVARSQLLELAPCASSRQLETQLRDYARTAERLLNKLED